MDKSEKQYIEQGRIFYAEQIAGRDGWINNVIEKLTENVYITIDLDVFDPAQLPSTGTPEPGGLFWYEVIKLLREVCERKNVVGFDVVELCPNEMNKGPDFLAAKLIYKLLSYKFRD
jgi:agmatinase